MHLPPHNNYSCSPSSHKEGREGNEGTSAHQDFGFPSYKITYCFCAHMHEIMKYSCSLRISNNTRMWIRLGSPIHACHCPSHSLPKVFRAHMHAWNTQKKLAWSLNHFHTSVDLKIVVVGPLFCPGLMRACMKTQEYPKIDFVVSSFIDLHYALSLASSLTTAVQLYSTVALGPSAPRKSELPCFPLQLYSVSDQEPTETSEYALAETHRARFPKKAHLGS